MEYYSGKDVVTQEDYVGRLQMFLANRTVLRLIKLENTYQRGGGHQKKRSNEFRSKGSKKSFYRERNSIKFNIELNKLSYRNSIYGKQFNAKELIKNFELGILRGCKIIEENLKDQRTQFFENIKQKHLNKILHSDSKVNARNQSFLKRKTISPDFNFRTTIKKTKTIKEEFSPLKSINFGHTGLFNSITLGEKDITSENNKMKNGKKKQTLGNVLDEYINKFRYTYYQQYCEASVRSTMDIIMESYNKKKEKFLEFNNQKIEFELMLDDNTSKSLI